jgi:type IV secretory pathway TrbF-like protein
VQVNKLGEAIAVSRADIAAVADQRVVHASVAAFINDLRMVTPDIALQRRAIFRAYAMLSNNDPATAKANEWFNSTKPAVLSNVLKHKRLMLKSYR